METRDPRVDAYIERAQPFAKPILTHVRRLATAIERISEGKGRNWKYERK